MQKRTTAKQKVEIVSRYLAGENAPSIASDYKITSVAIIGLLKRRKIKIRSQSQIQRKYPIDETFFDNINTQEKAYFLGFLYADGYNNTDRNSVNLSLKKDDKEILIKLNNLLQPAKPLQFISMEYNRKKGINASDQYRLVIANKHISNRLSKLGCVKAKTYTLEFPIWLSKRLYSHFIRGYNDGDGWIGQNAVSIVSTKAFCDSISAILKNELNINTCIRTRHPEHKNNIRMLEFGGGKKVRIFLKWLYKDASLYLKRKYDKYLKHLSYEKKLKQPRLCSINGCKGIHFGHGYCSKHHYEFCGGKEKRKIRYIETGR